VEVPAGGTSFTPHEAVGGTLMPTPNVPSRCWKIAGSTRAGLQFQNGGPRVIGSPDARRTS
jgi:hypothetical protein